MSEDYLEINIYITEWDCGGGKGGGGGGWDIPNASDRAPLVIGISDAQLKRITTKATNTGAAFA